MSGAADSGQYVSILVHSYVEGERDYERQQAREARAAHERTLCDLHAHLVTLKRVHELVEKWRELDRNGCNEDAIFGLCAHELDAALKPEEVARA